MKEISDQMPEPMKFDPAELSAEGMHYFYRGLEYREATQQLVQGIMLKSIQYTLLSFEPFFYNSALCVELLLKSYLIDKGFSAAELRKIGHNIEKAFDECYKKGMKIDNIPMVDLSKLSYVHTTDFSRYGFNKKTKGTQVALPIEINVMIIIDEIVDFLCKARNVVPPTPIIRR